MDHHVPGHRPRRGRMRRRRRGGPGGEHRHGQRARTPWSPTRRSRSRRSSTRSSATPTTPSRSRPRPTSRSSSRSGPKAAPSTWRCVPQPGAIAAQVDAGSLVSLEDLGFDIAELKALFGESLLSLGEFEGEHYGLPTNINLKSMVWYPMDDFDTAGYKVPDDLGRAARAVGPDRGGRRHALVRRLQVRRFHRLAGHRLDGGHHAPDGGRRTSMTSGLRTRSRSMTRRSLNAAETFGDVLFKRGLRPRWGADTPSISSSVTRRCRCSRARPKCWLHRQASFIITPSVPRGHGRRRGLRLVPAPADRSGGDPLRG